MTTDAINKIKKQGYVILENVLTEQECEMYKSMLSRDYEKYSSKYAKSNPTEHGLNDKGQEKIVYNLHNKDIKYFDLCDHPKIIPIIKESLQEGSYQNSQPFNLLGFDARNPSSNTKPQQLHVDSNIPGQGGYPLIMVALFMLDEFTEENGTTRIVPESHLRSDYSENGKKYDTEISVEGKKGSVLIFNGSLWHGGGKKRNDSSRWAIIPSYGRWFIKPAFNFAENIPPQIFDQLTDDRKDLLGLNTCPPKDEFTRITRRSTKFEWKNNYQLP
ncbi:phytanoyl-CoA dioxygenase family protein [Nitrosopumilus sp.]|uniref:phytanoyl-CoA dioxygenase family protein n=1 Tax=Nitrosopumilus sp. TaxID=2024843 RepID=UPI003D1038FE